MVETYNWMAHLNNNKKISHITIPGTHDTCSRHGGDLVKCQSMDLGQQLEAGIRFIDIRCRHINNRFAIHHGSVFQKLWFDDVLDVCSGFLTKNPSECIIMLVKEEYKQSGCTRSFDDTFWWYADTGYWNYNTNIPILEYVRGKIILLRRFKAKDAGIDVSQWPDNATFEHTNFDGVTYHVQDEYKVPTATVFDLKKKWEKIKNTLNVANIESAPNKIFLNYTSGVSGGAYPYTVANYINPRLVDYIKNITPESYSRGYGIIPMDFPHQDLINRLINLNFYI